MNIKVVLTHEEIEALIRKHIKDTFGEGAEMVDKAFEVQDEDGFPSAGFTVEVDVVLEKPKPIALGQYWNMTGAKQPWPKDDPYHGLGDEVGGLNNG